MDIVNLPDERAVEPNEQARQPGVNNNKGGCHSVTFAETTAPTSEDNSVYKDVLSQPPKGITHKQKLVWLQKRRTEGLWAQCDDCDRWRYLPQALDRHQLPAKWYCWMNPDTSLATCSAPEDPICLYDEDDLIHAEYAAGSVVLARMPGFPWWPAMVCDCPDTEQYYWLDGFSDIPTYYNVVFFDAFDVSRAWMSPEQLLPYKDNTKLIKKSLKIKNYKNRIEVAIIQANDAEKLPLSARLTKYSFIARFKGNIVTPKKTKKREIERYRNLLKRKFNIDFSDGSLSSEEDTIKADKNKSKRKNKKQNERKKTVTKNYPNTDISELSETATENLNTKNKPNTDNGELSETATENLNTKNTPHTDNSDLSETATENLNIKNNPNTDNNEFTETTTENLNSTRDLNSLAVEIDNASGLLKSIIVSEDSNNIKPQEISTVSDSLACETWQSQEDIDTVFKLTEDHSQKSDDFDF